MKYKLITGTTIDLAGIVSYHTPISNPKSSSRANDKVFNFSFDFDIPRFDFEINKEALKAEKEALKAEASRLKEGAKSYAEKPFMETFSKSVEQLGVQMEKFGKNMEGWGKDFEKNMTKWGEKLEEGISSFEKSMNSTQAQAEKQEEEINNHWSGNYPFEEYALWELESLFNELYNSYPSLQLVDKNPELFYEVQGYDLGTKSNDQLTFIGCQVSAKDSLPYSVVAQHLAPTHWLVLKLSSEEYAQDWIKKISSIDLIKDFTLEEYFVLRHFRDKEANKDKNYKIYVPLKTKSQ